MRRLNLKRTETGFTIVELMVAVAGFALVSLAAFSVLQSGQRTSAANDQVVKIQQSARLALDLMSRDIRMSGYGNPPGTPLPAGCASQLTATDQNPGGADAGADQIQVVTVGQVVGTLSVPFTAGNIITLNALPPGIVAVGNVISIEGIFTASVTGLGPGPTQLTLSNAIQSPRNFFGGNPGGASVVQLVCVTYAVSGPAPAAPAPPYQLLRTVGVGGAGNAVPIVDGIESIQLAYALDADSDGIIDTQPGSPPGSDCLDFVPNGTACGSPPIGPGTQLSLPVSVNASPTSVRQVRITVVGRAIPPPAAYFTGNCWRDPAFTGTSAIQAEDQFLDNTVANILPGCVLPAGTPPGIRRRALTRVVSLRDTAN